MKIDKNQQRIFFNDAHNQYKNRDLLKPPLHTVYELNRFISLLTNTIAGNNIIDFGSGTGRITLPLLEKKFHVSAVDVSSESLLSLERLAKEKGFESQLNTKETLLGLKADAIVGTDILHHVDLAEYIGKFPSHLNKNGMVLFSEPNAWNISWFFYFPLYALVKGVSVVKYIDVEKGFLQCRYWHIRRSLNKAGFGKVRLYGHGLIPPPLISWSPALSRINYFLSDLPMIRFFAYRFFIFAQK